MHILVSPLLCGIPGGATGGEEVAVDMQDALFNEKFIGHEATTMTEHGPGAVEPKAMSSPVRTHPEGEALAYSFAVRPGM